MTSGTVRSATPIHVRIGRPRPKRHHSPSAPSSWRRHGRGCRGRLPPHLPRIRSPPRARRTRCPGHHLGHWCLASRGRHVGRTLTFLGSGSGYACPCWFDGLIDQSAVGVGIVPTGSETSPVVQPATGTTGSERPTALAFIDNYITVPRRPPVLMQSRLGFAGGPNGRSWRHDAHHFRHPCFDLWEVFLCFFDHTEIDPGAERFECLDFARS